MPIEEKIVEVGSKKYKGSFDTGKNAFVNTLVEIVQAPESVTINPLSMIAQELLSDRDVLDTWLKASPTVNSVFNVGERSFNRKELDVFIAIVTADKDNLDNPLTDAVGQKIIVLLQQLKNGVK